MNIYLCASNDKTDTWRRVIATEMVKGGSGGVRVDPENNSLAAKKPMVVFLS